MMPAVADEQPSRLEQLAYRGLGVRLDDRWDRWVRHDLERRGWAWRQRGAAVVVYAVLGLVAVLGARSILGRPPLAAFSGLLGGFVGQLLATEARRSAIRRSYLAPPRNPIIAGLHFGERLTLSCSLLVLVLAVAAAGAFAVRDDPTPCRPASPGDAEAITRAAAPGTTFGDDAAAIEVDPRTLDLVARQVSLRGAPPRIGVWAVRRDGEVLPLGPVADAVTAPSDTDVGFSFPAGRDIPSLVADVRRCLRSSA
jgi:hypothetical protein